MVGWEGTIALEKGTAARLDDTLERSALGDQFAFEQNRFGLIPDEVHIEIVNGIDQRPELQVPAHLSRRMKILGDAPAQIPGFADINHRAKPIFHQVNAGFMGQLTQFLANMFARRHSHTMPEQRRF